ncbi:MAG: aminoacyl-tRNA hydrolase [Bacteroidia bacterium]|nr:aminoacyl-tRNA hydrolase [Bacteroidia bacterium]
MKYLIAGLGNIGEEYRLTRHNIGFMVVQQLAARAGVALETDRYAATATMRHKGRQLMLIQPSTYMNLSGNAVRYHLQKHNVPIENLMVITDDINLAFGAIRIRPKGSDGGHNGLKHIESILTTQSYARMRIGVGNEFARGRQADYVLSPFEAAEIERLPALLDACADAVLTFATAGLNQAMNQYNKS